MKKITLLAASVAVALTGCGGGSSSSGGAAPSGTTITAFDGYFKNAVVFVDKNNNGAWDLTSDTFVGLTDANGQVDLGDITVADGESLAVQTITPTGSAINNLLTIDPELYAGTYTVDMDAPGQSMEHELVFRAPHKSDVISPITDLVAIEYKATGDLETAEQTIVDILGDGQDVDLYSDFVEGSKADAAMHKTAQIITESKAEAESNGATYDATVAKKVAEEADSTVDSITDEGLLEDDSFKPVVPVAVDGTVEPIPATEISDPDYKTIVNAEIYEDIQEQLNKLDLTFGDAGSTDYFLTVDISNLFVDKNIEDDETFIEVSRIIVDGKELQEGNVELVLHLDTGKLNIGVSPSKTIKTAGEFTFNLVSENTDKTNATEAAFTINIDEGDAKAPEVNPIISNTITTTLLEEWDLQEGTLVAGPEYTISYANLFTGSNLELSIESNLERVDLALANSSATEEFTLSGTPTMSSEDTSLKFKVWITAEDTETGLETKVTFDVNDIADEPEPELHPLEDKVLYFVETPESDDDVKLNRCETFYLNEGNVYYGDENYSGDVNTNCAPASDTASATYSIEGDVITILENDYAPMTLEVKHTSKLGTSTRFTVMSVEKEDEGDDFGTFEAMTSKAETENRLNAKSTDTWDNLSQLTTLFINGEYVELNVTPQMKNEQDSNGEVADADLWIENQNGDITCSDIQNSFDAGYFGEQWASFEEGSNCWTKTENGMKYLSLDFDYDSEFTKSSVHRIQLTGLTEQEPSFNMNIQYVGDSSYE